MTMCNICLRNMDTEKLDRLDLCKACLTEVKIRVKEIGDTKT